MTQAEAFVQEGVAHQRAGRIAAARGCYRAAVAARPAQPDVWHVLALLAAEAGDSEEAVESLRRALQVRPGDAGLWADLGACLHKQGRPAEAETALQAALRHDPAHARALGTLGLVLAGQGEAQAEAEACLRAALRLDPTAAGTHSNLGNLLRDQGRLAEAELHLRTALVLRPGEPDALHNLGVMLAGAGRIDEALACCHAGLAVAPEHADLRFLLGTTLLLAGRLREGWGGFAWRWRRRGHTPPRRFEAPAWDGADWGRGTLLLYAEEGLGDSIQMLRFIPALAARGRVVLEVPTPLLRLAATLGGDAMVVGHGAALPAFERSSALMDLPRLLGVGLDEIPARVPYLAADAAASGAWRRRLAALPGLRVGLVWAGNRQYLADARRSLPEAALAALAGIGGISFVSLQKPPPTAAPPLPLTDWTGELDDLADTAALIAGLDLVITVDTAVVHLAGALGVPVWLLNRFDTCWRWMLGRQDSPWYPTLRIFRQPAPGDWGGVLAAVRTALAGPRPHGPAVAGSGLERRALQ
jgi:Flp pilus assembly protein TadD